MIALLEVNGIILEKDAFDSGDSIRCSEGPQCQFTHRGPGIRPDLSRAVLSTEPGDGASSGTGSAGQRSGSGHDCHHRGEDQGRADGGGAGTAGYPERSSQGQPAGPSNRSGAR